MPAPTTGSSPPPPSPPDGASAPPPSATSTASPASTSSPSAAAVPLRRQRPLHVKQAVHARPRPPDQGTVHLVTEALLATQPDASGPCWTSSTVGPGGRTPHSRADLEHRILTATVLPARERIAIENRTTDPQAA